MVPSTLLDRFRALFKRIAMKSVSSNDDDIRRVNNPKEEEEEPQPTQEETSQSMVNSITLSTDQDILYLIDDGRCIEFPLKSKNGILVGTIRGQITVATAKAAPTTEEGSDAPRKIRVATGDNMHWTTFYNEDSEVFGLIGLAEIDISLAEPKTQVYLVDLKENVITLGRKGVLIELTVYPKESSRDSGKTIIADA